MTKDNSPYYAAGLARGLADRQVMTSCPAGIPEGMDTDMGWSVMYQRGYADGIDNAAPHQCTAKCRRGAPGE